MKGNVRIQKAFQGVVETFPDLPNRVRQLAISFHSAHVGDPLCSTGWSIHVRIENHDKRQLAVSSCCEYTSPWILHVLFHAHYVAGSKMSYGYAASDKCIIWNEHQENQSVLKIFNRQTNDLKSMDETNGIGSFSLQENHLLSLSMVKNAEQQFVPAYTILNLVTGQVDILVEHTTGSRSKPAIDGEKAVIS